FGNDLHRYELNIILFRVIQELLSNTIKHSFAKNVAIHINSFDDILNIMYEDDGIGFSYDPVQSGLGLDNVESRIRSIKGTLKFESGKFGTSYTIDIPVTVNL
ncbi:MAG: ATP-binding protein, partial [Flavobacterium sp.]